MRLVFTLAALFALAPFAAGGPGSTASADPAAAPSRPALVPCRIPGVPARDRVLCGHVDVPESAASGRTIAVRYAVVRARRHDTGAIFEIVGGPGQSAIDFAKDYVAEGTTRA